MNVTEAVPGAMYTTLDGVCLILSMQLLPIVNNNQRTANIAILVTNCRNGRCHISVYKHLDLSEIFEDQFYLLPEITD